MRVGSGMAVQSRMRKKIEKVHLEAARIITGLPIYATRESLYKETGWEN